jgi:hypothetical protein
MAIRDFKDAWQIGVPKEPERLTMSALAPKMSALPPKADIGCRFLNVRYGPKADIRSLHYLVSCDNQARRNGKAKRFCRF